MISLDASDLKFWEKESLSKYTFEKLKLVKMTYMSAVPHEMEFIKFLLSRSPVLEAMTVAPCSSCAIVRRLHMLTELVRFRRASSQAEIVFIQD